jgi:hypothetical protein
MLSPCENSILTTDDGGLGQGQDKARTRLGMLQTHKLANVHGVHRYTIKKNKINAMLFSMLCFRVI